MTFFKQLTEDFWVAPQLGLADFAKAKELGIRTVINKRRAQTAGTAKPESVARATDPGSH